MALASAWPALLLSVICLLPFLNKAFLIDDSLFLAMAGQIVTSPLHPTNFELCWNVVSYCAKAYELAPGNTLMGYTLVPTVLFGAKEWMAHLTQLIFVWVAVIEMSSLVLRMGWSRAHAVTGALLLVAIPPLLPMASTAMPDVLALSVGLVGIERLAAWREEGKWHQGAVAALALGLAGVARVHLALLIPLGAIFLIGSTNPREILRQIRQSLWLWAPVLGGGLILAAVVLTTRERGLLLSPPANITGLKYIRANLHSYLLYFCFPLPLAACSAAAQWTTGRSRVVFTVLAATTIAWLTRDRQLIFVLVGGYALADLLWQAWRNRDREGLWLGLWLLVPLPVTYYQQFPIKYLLPCLPAVILIWFRLSSAVPVRIARTGAILVIIGGTIFSLIILRSDAEFANFGRDALITLIRPHTLAGEKVWFPSQFSAYWYASAAGAELAVPGVREPQRGDLFVVGSYELDKTGMLKKFPNRILVQALAHKYRFGRTMAAGAGFYYNPFGNWLWVFRNGDDGRYELWRLN